MKLSLSTIREITCGAVRVEQEEKGIRFYRFTEKELELYRQKNGDLYLKALTTAGMRLRFRTNSKHLGIKVLIEHTIGRKFFSVDVYANEKNLGYVDNFRQEELPRQYFDLEFGEGVYEKSFGLEDDTSLVEIVLPWNRKLTLLALELDDGATVEPAKREKKLLVYGDSITQGYDALRPSNRYAGKIAVALGAEEFNKAIGGECFYPELAEEKVDFQPDYILVAYGTNDWSKNSPQVFAENCKAFYAILARNYPGIPILALTPIWRGEMATRASQFDSFQDIEDGIRSAVAGLEQVTVLRGYEFVPHDINCFSDAGLHPNDVGFSHYADNLWTAIQDSGVLTDRL